MPLSMNVNVVLNWELNKIWKYIIGKKNCIDSQNELIIFVKSRNLTNTFNSI